MKTIYLSGPITGMLDGNAAAFFNAQYDLSTCNTIVINPVTISKLLEDKSNFPPSWLEYMAADIPELIISNEIYMLRGWWKSRGARIEFIIALLFRKRVRFEPRRRKL